MATCIVTGRKKVRGISYAIRGIAKKKKGIGLNITGKTKRWFEPNIQKKKIWYAEQNRFVTLSLSTAALRTIERYGLVTVLRKMESQGIKV
jgi:large subunit ribosomal protein L28